MKQPIMMNIGKEVVRNESVYVTAVRRRAVEFVELEVVLPEFEYEQMLRESRKVLSSGLPSDDPAIRYMN